jgi:TonB-linked SusC/RagA family outer membrane protein
MQKNAFRNREGRVHTAYARITFRVPTKTLHGIDCSPGRQHFKIGKKFLTMMKFTAFMLLVCCLHVSANTRSQTVTMSGRDIPLSKVFTVIKKQTGYAVFGNASLLKQTRNVSISVSNMPLTEFLDSVFKQQPITYRIVDRTIILYSKSNAAIQFPNSGAMPARPEQTTILKELPFVPINGVVVGADGVPVSGASVRIKGTNTGVATDAGGKFSINANIDQTLVFSHVSMTVLEVKVKEFPVNGRIIMKPKEATLGDVVVTGYGNIRKESFTGTYTQVTKAEIQKVTANNLIGALQVFDPSFRILQNINMGSNPNVLPEFYIRGQSGFPGVKELDRLESGTSVSQFSLRNNPNTPIFIMDGFEITVEKVYDMDINRIANVTILKDAAATALYGSRASNGVVVIETIAPKAGELRVNYNGNFSITAPDLSSYSMMNAQQKYDAEMAAQIYLPWQAETDPGYKDQLIENLWYQQQKKNEILKGVNTYWLSQPLQTQFNNRQNVYIEGGSQSMRVGLELKYDKQNGVMKESFRDRLAAGLTVQYQTTKVQIRNQTYFDVVKADDSPFGEYSNYTKLQPYYPLYDEATGKYVRNFPNYYGNTDINPMYESTVGNFSKQRYKEWTNNFTVNWYLTKFLFIRGQLALDYKQSDQDKFISPESTIYDRGSLFTKGELSQSETNSLDWNTNLFASYNQNIDKHNINLSLGINARSVNEEYITALYRGFPNASYHSPAYAYEITRKPQFNDNKTRLVGGFATANYSLNDIYLFDASFRVDGSSEFGTEEKWAPFWSVGTGMNLHNTSFLKNNKTIDMLRVTANIGQTGKSNFSPFMARNTYQVMLDDWYPTGIGASLIYMGNNNLTWEKQISWNIGTMMSFLKRFTLELNYYNKETYDLITDVSLPSSAGFAIYRENIGKVLNKGFEIKTSINAVNARNLNLTFIGNIAHNRNRIVEIAQSLKSYNNRIDEYYKGYIDVSDPQFALIYNDLNAKYAKPIMKYEEGSSLTTIYGMKSLGINPANGKEVFQKRDGTITYDWDPTEQQIIGNAEPWAQGTFGVNARYKRFTLFSTFMFEWGGEQYNNTLVDNVENVNLQRSNADTRVLTDRWQKPGDVTPLKALQDRYFITRPTSRFIQRNNYIGFNSFSLGYDFDPAWLKVFRMRSLRTTFMMNDVARFSTIKREMGLDYPYARTFTLTINATF